MQGRSILFACVFLITLMRVHTVSADEWQNVELQLEDVPVHIFEESTMLERQLGAWLSNIHDCEKALDHTIFLSWMQIQNGAIRHRNNIRALRQANIPHFVIHQNERVLGLLSESLMLPVVQRRLSGYIIDMTTSRLNELVEKCVVLISDRRDPMDANSGWTYNGTLDRNGPTVKTYSAEEIDREFRLFQHELSVFKDLADEMKLSDVRAQIEKMQQEVRELNFESVKALWQGVVEAIGAGMSVTCPPLALAALLQSVESFKEFGDLGYQAGEVSKEIEKFMEIEKSLERGLELQKMVDLRG